jgi:hypothetical protein
MITISRQRLEQHTFTNNYYHRNPLSTPNDHQPTNQSLLIIQTDGVWSFLRDWWRNSLHKKAYRTKSVASRTWTVSSLATVRNETMHLEKLCMETDTRMLTRDARSYRECGKGFRVQGRCQLKLHTNILLHIWGFLRYATILDGLAWLVHNNINKQQCYAGNNR